MLSPYFSRLLRAAALAAEPRLTTGDGTGNDEAATSRTVCMAAIPGHSLIIDCETLDTTPRSIITEIGAVAFRRSDFSIVDTLDINLDIYDQLATRTVSQETIDFHRSNGTLPSSAIGIRPLLAAGMVQEFVDRYRPVRVWIQGTCFERPLIQDFFEDLGKGLPWHFTRSSDCRTEYATAFHGAKHPSRPHHALEDCLATLTDLEASLTALNRRDAC